VTTTATVTNTVVVPYCAGVLCDNFEDGNADGWTVRQGAAQDFDVVVDDTHVYRQINFGLSWWHISQAGSTWTDQTVEARIKPLEFLYDTSFVALFGRYDATPGVDCGYYVALRGDCEVALRKHQNGVEATLGHAACVGITPGTWYDVKLEIVGTSLHAYINGTLVLTETDSSCTAGSIAVGSLGAAFSVDDVVVSAVANPPSPEPGPEPAVEPPLPEPGPEPAVEPARDGGTPETKNSCLQSWPTTFCGQWCMGQNQSDRIACELYLDCYFEHNCGPTTCGSPDDVCGANVLDHGIAPKTIADSVYQCLGCP
jgi:hypothetical protein